MHKEIISGFDAVIEDLEKQFQDLMNKIKSKENEPELPKQERVYIR